MVSSFMWDASERSLTVGSFFSVAPFVCTALNGTFTPFLIFYIAVNCIFADYYSQCL